MAGRRHHHQHGPKAAQQQQGQAKMVQQGFVVKPQLSMALRAAVAVLLCVALITYLYLNIRGRALLWLVAAAELAFCVHYWFLCVPYFTTLAHKQAPEDHDTQYIRARLIEQLFRVDDIMAAMESWFLDAKPGDVRKDNLKELFAYAIWYRSLDEMKSEGLMPELDDLMLQLEERYGRRVPDGYNPNLRFMSHLWEPLRHIYRPLAFYIVMELLALLCHVVLLSTGFSLRELDGITYYTYKVGRPKLVSAISTPLKRSRSSAAVQTAAGDPEEFNVPVVFLHGVGAGLLPYLVLICRLAALGRPMILPHSRHVSMRLVSWIPTVDDMADATAAMLASHGFSKAAVLAHSYGTMVASRLVMKYPQLVHSMCLTDPVCFAMFMPNLLRSFLYGRHPSTSLVLNFIMRMVASELHCCANFSRKFFWSSINLWDEHIPARTLVVLGGQDTLSPAAHVSRWLKEHTHAQVLYEPTMHHAGFLLDMDWQATIVTAFANMMQQPCSDSAFSADATVKVTAPAAAGRRTDAVKSSARSDKPSALAGKQQPSCAPAAASGGLQHVCAHPRNRLCSDCLISCQLPQALPAGVQTDAESAAIRTGVPGKLSTKQQEALTALASPFPTEQLPSKAGADAAARRAGDTDSCRTVSAVLDASKPAAAAPAANCPGPAECGVRAEECSPGHAVRCCSNSRDASGSMARCEEWHGGCVQECGAASGCCGCDPARITTAELPGVCQAAAAMSCRV